MNFSLLNSTTSSDRFASPILYGAYLVVTTCATFFTLLTISGLTLVHKPALALTRILAVSDLCAAVSGVALATDRILLAFTWPNHTQPVLYCIVPILGVAVSIQVSFFHYILIAGDRLQAMRWPLEYRSKNHR